MESTHFCRLLPGLLHVNHECQLAKRGQLYEKNFNTSIYKYIIYQTYVVTFLSFFLMECTCHIYMW